MIPKVQDAGSSKELGAGASKDRGAGELNLQADDSVTKQSRLLSVVWCG